MVGKGSRRSKAAEMDYLLLDVTHPRLLSIVAPPRYTFEGLRLVARGTWNADCAWSITSGQWHE